MRHIGQIGAVLIFLTFGLTAQAQDCDTHTGAGILIYSVDASGQRFLLLGYESRRGWSSFGGRPKLMETLNPKRIWCETRKETALREGHEEMRMLVPKARLKQELQTATFFPKTPSDDDFVTFILKTEKFDTAAYYSTPVPYRSGYTETQGIAWIPLAQLIDRLTEKTSDIDTPNEKDLWPVFWNGLAAELKHTDWQQLFP